MRHELIPAAKSIAFLFSPVVNAWREAEME